MAAGCSKELTFSENVERTNSAQLKENIATTKEELHELNEKLNYCWSFDDLNVEKGTRKDRE